MNGYLRHLTPWMQLVMFLGITAGIFLVTLKVGNAAIGWLYHVNVEAALNDLDASKPYMAQIITGLLVLQFVGLFAGPALLFSYLADPDPLTYAGLRMPKHRYTLVIGIIVFLCASFTVEWLTEFNVYLVDHYAGKDMQAWIRAGEQRAEDSIALIAVVHTPRELVRAILLMGVFAAVGEELFFRGILQRLLIQITGRPWAGILVTGALFSIVHFQFLGLIPRFMLGSILGAVCWYSGSLIPAIVGHFVYNTLQVLLIYFDKASLGQKPDLSRNASLAALAAAIVVAILLVFLVRRSTVTVASLYPDKEEEEAE